MKSKNTVYTIIFIGIIVKSIFLAFSLVGLFLFKIISMAVVDSIIITDIKIYNATFLEYNSVTDNENRAKIVVKTSVK